MGLRGMQQKTMLGNETIGRSVQFSSMIPSYDTNSINDYDRMKSSFASR